MIETNKIQKQPKFQCGSFSKILQEAKFDKKILVSLKGSKKDPLTNRKAPFKAKRNNTNSESNYTSETETQPSYTSSSFSSYTSSSESSWDSFSNSGTESKTSNQSEDSLPKSDSIRTPDSTGSTSSTSSPDTTSSPYTNSEDSNEESKIISNKLSRLQTKRKHVYSHSQVFFPKKKRINKKLFISRPANKVSNKADEEPEYRH
ncbi:hypothetical protein M0813_17600 [Anaeramoeba flamelloides]|uniref:Uncharacterized protein n=1 Tax=Anaeramoeba flamelloides TaxID=1746091 RepID=A0ABQ8YV40_9EUKA|nr:hypothetical protein M0813_17600 [Anaeramoeba flamelloides]